jgi:tetratricopeptide (TPR) repeat protein
MANYYYYTSKSHFKYIVSLCLLIALTRFSIAQDNAQIQLANEYLTQGEKQKARELYEELVRHPENVALVHNNYLALLIDLGEFKSAEEYLQRQLRRNPDNVYYRVDLGLMYLKSGDLARGDKQIRSLIKETAADGYQVKQTSDYLASKGLYEYATMALQEARTNLRNPTLYSLELANLYRIQGLKDAMVQEYLNYVTQVPSNMSYVKNMLQAMLNKPDELESLERLLYERVQQYPDSEVYSDLLIWAHLQQRNFFGAYVQSRAFDKRFRKDGSKTLEIAQVALSNKDFETADMAYTYVIREFPSSPHYFTARLGVIQAREARVKNRFPVNRDSVVLLVGEYDRFISQYRENNSAYEAIRNKALLQAYYLQQLDTATVTLQRLIAMPRGTAQLKAKAKLDLGDIYLVKGEPWESTLLYSQVEKSFKDSPIGYEAKLKNARLNYYRGEFHLALDHLDILKEATTREISNDAMDLGLRIRENTAFDSAGTALRDFAAVELLLWQNQTAEALSLLDNMKAVYGHDPIMDDVYWLEAGLRLKLGEFDLALAGLQKILDAFGDDILADDAYFMQGETYERHLNDPEKAREIYRQFLDRFPGSVHVAEARKRYRTLRGDFERKDGEDPN